MFNFKFYREKRAELAQKMQDLLSNAEIEQRALSAEEEAEFNDCEEKIKRIDATVEAEERARKLVEEPEEKKPAEQRAENKKTPEQKEEAEIRAFCDFVRGMDNENRAENIISSESGAVVPTSVANRIIARVKDLCPLYSLAKRYNAKGILNIPYLDVYDNTTSAGYVTEGKEADSNMTGTFKAVELKGYVMRATAKVPKSIINNSDIDVLNFVVEQVSDEIISFINSECFNGASGKIVGLSKAKNVIVASAETAVTADELIDLQESVPDKFQNGAVWIMNRKTRAAIRKLKDKDGNFILNPDPTARWGYKLFGADVFTDENVSEMSAGKRAIYYGDLTGLAIKVSEDINVEILRERYAEAHCIGVVAFAEIDSAVENEQKIAVLKMAGEAAA